MHILLLMTITYINVVGFVLYFSFVHFVFRLFFVPQRTRSIEMGSFIRVVILHFTKMPVVYISFIKLFNATEQYIKEAFRNA